MKSWDQTFVFLFVLLVPFLQETLVRQILELLFEILRCMYIIQQLTLKEARGGWSKSARWSGDRLPFLTGSCYGHKNSILDFIHKHLN